MFANDQDAYSHYNQHYQNSTYTHIQQCVIKDLLGEDAPLDRDTLSHESVLSLDNAVTDAALCICGVSNMAYGLKSLLLKVVQHKLSEATLQAIATHLKLFEQRGDTSVEDFLATVTSLQQTQIALDSIETAISHASQIHSSAGRSAYHLLRAIQMFTRSAEILLQDGNTDYGREKLEAGVHHLTYAQQELDT